MFGLRDVIRVHTKKQKYIFGPDFWWKLWRREFQHRVRIQDIQCLKGWHLPQMFHGQARHPRPSRWSNLFAHGSSGNGDGSLISLKDKRKADSQIGSISLYSWIIIIIKFIAFMGTLNSKKLLILIGFIIITVNL